MELRTTGRVVVQAEITNWDDLKAVKSGTIGEREPRRVVVDDALVDTGATYLALPTSLIRRLGLVPTRQRKAKTAAGTIIGQINEPVQLTVMGRECWPEVSEIADACPVLIGQIPLESLDLLVDPQGRRLIGNPDHGGEHMFELY